MKKFDIWIEGYSIAGEKGKAMFVGTYPGDDFANACKTALIDKEWGLDHYNEEKNTYWACRFFDNEEDARRMFG